MAWAPALDRPDLLALPVRAALATLDLAAWSVPIDPDLADTAAFCDTYGVGLAESANCVVVAGRRAEATRYAAVVVPADRRADVNGVVRRELDVRKISFAGMDDAVERTGMAYGGITPVGLPADWPVLVDPAVSDRDWVVIGSGVRGSKLAMPGASLLRLPEARTLALTH